MTSLNSLLTSLKSSNGGSWGTAGGSSSGSSSSTWGGSANSYTHLPTLKIKKQSSSQKTAAGIMAKTTKKKGSHSLFGEILGKAVEIAEINPRMAGNLVTDLVSTAENLPTGLYKTATTNPLDTAKAVGADYKKRYGMLFDGHIEKFGKELINHPLAPALDAFTVATLGAGTAVKAGLLSGELESTGLRTSRAIAEQADNGQMSLLEPHMPSQVQVNLSRNPATRRLQKIGHGTKRLLPENIPVVGEKASAQRALGQQYLHDVAGLDSGAKALKTKEYVAKYGEDATTAIQKYAQTQVPGGILAKPTQLWKDAVLAGRPAFQINNFVGNQLMYQMGSGIRQDVAIKSLQMAKNKSLDAAWEDFKGSENTLGHTEAGEGGSKYRHVVNKSYNFQGKGELWLRKAAMRNAAMANPEIRTLTRKYMSEGVPVEGKNMLNKQGRVWGKSVEPNVKLSEGDALARAIKDVTAGPEGAAIKREITGKIEDTLGNYNHYNKFEANLKKAVPFYGWNRHSTRFLYATARDRPGELLAAHQLGQIGEKEHAKFWGGTPDFMQGYLKIGSHTFDTHPLNPVTGATDTLKAVRELVSGDIQAGSSDLTSSINPIATAAIQGVTGKSLLSGAPVDRSPGGLLGSVVKQTVTGLPQVGLAKQALSSAGVLPGPDRNDPHHFLTATGRLKEKYKDLPLGPDGLPVEPKNTHMLNPTFESKFATFIGVPDRGTVNQRVAKKVEASIKTEKGDSTGFHAAKKRKKKAPTLKQLHAATTRSGGWGASSTGWGG